MGGVGVMGLYTREIGFEGWGKMMVMGGRFMIGIIWFRGMDIP